MKTAYRILPATLVASLLTASVALAHHSFTMFDRTVERVATGSSRTRSSCCLPTSRDGRR